MSDLEEMLKQRHAEQMRKEADRSNRCFGCIILGSALFWAVVIVITIKSCS